MPAVLETRPLTDFLVVRDRLMRIATRIAGAEAEDVVQDAWLRWQRVDHNTVLDPSAYLSRTTVHLSINRAQQRPTSALTPAVLPPEPSADPADRAAAADELRTALALLVARLEPRARVAYTLREAFELPYRQIGVLLGITEAHTRQLVNRARRRLAAGPDRPVPRDEHRALLAAFRHTARTGDPRPLAGLARTPESARPAAA
ncbi:sigma-70 family RNA polymerase sigma factor [Actinoplanes sp. TRM 88003]|uniref:Sigma-70 family RNA polymerase sigma factor n=1 Tax=Paractinoplanes aksuensis TaxID=2939490 RepID=A0ABT1DHP0_9ACTN|nr:sigma-70 family RNA polymerase sigma factor [Actinoplanes aksuensis]MCO8270330.1 sigma-70 family RNA polymerase sigma factor [Actinoplanes aksuensis]